MSAFLKRLIPPSLRAGLRQWKKARGIAGLHREWDQASRRLAGPGIAQPARRLLILPSDPAGIVGAVGDDAMITATTQHFVAENPDVAVSVLCQTGAAERIVRDLGFKPVPLPAIDGYCAAIAEILQTGPHDALVALGADVMDGYYSAEFTTKVLIGADIAARMGMRSIVLGFSFNAQAAPELARCFARLSPEVALNVRDPLSLDRLNGFARVRARLVADAAFTLRPGTIDADTEMWIAGEKAARRRVIGLNLHPMLIRPPDPGQIDRLVSEMAEAVVRASAQAPLSWLLLPHDYRDDSGDGDGICLRPLMQRLQAEPGIRCRYFEGRHRAATLKALAGRMDGIVTGRMHLAIAALGMGVPVMCLTYQDKFEGLFRHFDLPADLLLRPEALAEPGRLAMALDSFLNQIDDLAAGIAGRRPGVVALAERNFLPGGSAHQ